MRRRRRLLWQLYPSYLLIITLSLGAIGWYAADAARQMTLDNSARALQAEAVLFRLLIADKLTSQAFQEIDTLCKQIGASISTRVTVALANGRVVGDSDFDPTRLETFALRPEIKEALHARVGIVRRHSFTMNSDLLFVAVPVEQSGAVTAAVRMGKRVEEVMERSGSVAFAMGLGAVVIVILGAGFGFYVARLVNKPLLELKTGAEKYARGDLKYRLRTDASEEIDGLAEAMNIMAAQLDERVQTIANQRNELEAVLSDMVEAVLALDNEARIIRINRAAEELFGIKGELARGRPVGEAIRTTELKRFVNKALAAAEQVEAEIVVLGAPDRHLQAHGTPLNDSGGDRIGVLVVLNDITRMKNLEKMRRDFVANVSHELRTPITSIQGFLETLKEGAIHDPENAERFLDIMIKHTNRLSMIIEDLLSLSRIEQEREKGGIALKEASVKDALIAAIKTCGGKASEKEITLSLACPEHLKATINSTLLEQAAANLVDNAIKFSDPGETVILEAELIGGDVLIRVIDHGCGIAREHLDRIFERFYRVDKSRSSKEGGAGLGLAIVKHIANAHGGRVSVQSSHGEGSAFIIHLPA
ncbi:MAG: PAS domain-containing protein [Deltaproteobacteria bacterium]|nr:PAS domain-containing protein [Deltaproteobacteria bacterium]